MIPVYDASTTNQTKFENVVCHEMGGHGFGKLADEYRYYNELIPNDKKSTLIAWQGRDYNLNVSVTSILTDVPWSNIINKEGYSHVGVFPGAYLYMQGVWRSEYVSCMEDNRMYYNAQSRRLIVKRIFEVAKEDLTWNKFVAKDVIKSEPSVMTKSVDPNFRPLGNPIMIME